MKAELTNIVSEAHWGQEPVGDHGRFAWIDRQHASFQNANNTITSARAHSASLLATPASKFHVIRSAEGQWERSKGAGNVGGNVFGSQLDPIKTAVPDNRGRVLLFTSLATAPTQTRDEPWLERALEELASCPDDAIEDGFDKPSECGLIKARELIMNLAIHVESQPDIYPMDQGSIAIDIRHPNGTVGVLCLIERDGSGVLFSRSQKAKGRVRVNDASDLLREGGLSEMKRLGISL